VTSFSVERYLGRIGDSGPRDPSLDTLARLQLAHLTRVPFENLHVFHRLGVRVDVEWSYAKLVEQGRGGWCFELNGAFAELLRQLGYDVDLLSCRTYQPATSDLSPAFDHLALLVHTAGTRHLVDVGWGDNALSPIPAEPGEYPTLPRPTRIETDASTVRLLELVASEDGTPEWELQYEAARRPVQLGQFEERSRYLQTEPGLKWTEKPLVTRATSALGGRVTLLRDRLRVRSDDLTSRDDPVAAGQWAGQLQTWFDMSGPGRERAPG
jgi:N-hydroxyarylamine O-acetyltransferase